MYKNKKQLQFIWILKPELEEMAKRIAEDHTKWMHKTHHKEGEKELLMLNWSIGPEMKDGEETGNLALMLTEIYSNQVGIDDHFEQAQNSDSYYRDNIDDFTKMCESRVTIQSAHILESMW